MSNAYSLFRVAAFTHDQRDSSIKDFAQTIAPQNAGYLRLRALNSGKNTWIFADEILVEN